MTPPAESATVGPKQPVDPTVLIVESDWIVGRALERVLALSGNRVLGITPTSSAVSTVNGHALDVALIALHENDLSLALEVARQLHQRNGACIIFLADHWTDTLAGLRNPEPSGVLIKPFVEEQVVAEVALATRKAMHLHEAQTGAVTEPREGDVDPAVQGRAVREATFALAAASDLAASTTGGVPLDTILTRRQLEIVRLLLANGRVRTIAEDLHVSPHTVRNHLKSIYDKLGVHSQVDLIRKLTEIVGSEES